MGLFGKKENKEVPELPELPELPKLPDFSELESSKRISSLPSYPNNYLGNKFSQNTIKGAVLGKQEDDEEDADDFVPSMEKMMQPPSPKRFTIEETNNFETKMPEKLNSKEFLGKDFKKEKGPFFVRLDKFEESLEIFEDTKKKLLHISRILDETKQIKEKETETLGSWEKELEEIKEKIERIDRELFSKI